MTSLSPRIQDVLTRAGKTFVQAAIATVAASTAAGVPADSAGWRALAIAALSAGISAAWNMLTSATAPAASGQ